VGEKNKKKFDFSLKKAQGTFWGLNMRIAVHRKNWQYI
jgi:hypothetical protein